MTNQTDNISLQVQRHHDTLIVNLKPFGCPNVTDFQKLTDMLEVAVYSLQASTISLFIDMSDLQNISAKSAWNDIFRSVKMGAEFDRIAVYGRHPWQNLAIKTLSWLISPNVKVFERKEEATYWAMAS